MSGTAQAKDAARDDQFAAAMGETGGWRPLPLTIIINGKEEDQPSLVVIRGPSIWVRQADAVAWGLQGATAPATATLKADGVTFVDLAAIAGLSTRLDADTTTLEVFAEADLFGTRRYSAASARMPVAEAVPAMFVEYDLSVTRWHSDVQAAAWVDAGLTGSWGVLGTTAVASDHSDGTGQSLVRLDTSFQHEFVQSDLHLVLGDTQTGGGAINRPVLFAGIRLGRDFAFDPQAITMPLPSVIGATALPSTVELVSGGAQQSLQADRGRFVFDFIPQFTGAGQVTMTIRDLAGNTRQITQDFYTGQDLLRPGLATFSLEAGFLRKDYGLRSFAYGAPFAALGWRQGLTGWLTVDGRLEASSAVRMAGVGANLILGTLGELGLAAATSQSQAAGQGALWRVSARRITPRYAVSAGYEHADENFHQLGEEGRPGGARSDLTASASLNLSVLGSINAGFVHSRRVDSTFTIGSLFWSATLGRTYATLGGQMTRSGTVGLGYGLFANATVPLGKRRVASLTADRDRVAASFEQAAPADRGLGYHVLAGRDLHDGGTWTEGGFEWRNGAGELDVVAQHRGGQTSVGLRAHGALIAAEGAVATMPRLDYGFALVDLPGPAQVTLNVENRPTAATVGGGRKAIIGGLQPYAPNSLSINPDALPIEQLLGASEVLVVPGWRQVARVHFDAGGAHHPLRLIVVDTAGNVLAPGSLIELADGTTNVVGYDGQVFLPDGDAARLAPLKIAAGGGSCEAAVPPLAPEDSAAPPPIVTCTPPLTRT